MYIPVLYLELGFLHNKLICPGLIYCYQYLKRNLKIFKYLIILGFNKQVIMEYTRFY